MEGTQCGSCRDASCAAKAAPADAVAQAFVQLARRIAPDPDR
ncbi:hypothetical protein [Geoalkalibacter halelectricus]